MPDKIYTAAKTAMGTHITLNPAVPDELGCAEAVSFVLKQAGIEVPQLGFAGTYDLWRWLENSKLFNRTDHPTKGGIVIAPTGTSTKGASEHGHIGVTMMYGICSNNSSTGLFEENYSFAGWEASFSARGFTSYYYYAI